MSDFKELWRRKNIAYAPIRGIAGERVYPEHISGVKGAKYPAISLFTLANRKTNHGLRSGQYQMDTWSTSEQEAKLLQDYLEKLYHPDYINSMPTGNGVSVKFLQQLDRRDGAYERDRKLFHKISIYAVVWEEI